MSTDACLVSPLHERPPIRTTLFHQVPSDSPTTQRRTHVANIKSQIKRNRQNEAAHERNKAVKTGLKSAVRKFRELAEGEDKAAAGFAAKDAAKKLDQAASKGVIHKNQAANRKSAIAKKAATL
jgi:small subunit ribosomal protein S20